MFEIGGEDSEGSFFTSDEDVVVLRYSEASAFGFLFEISGEFVSGDGLLFVVEVEPLVFELFSCFHVPDSDG